MNWDLRIVLKPGVSRDEVGFLAARYEWWLLSIGRESDEYIRDEWRAKDDGTFVVYIEDPVVNLPYLLVKGPSADAVAETIRRGLPVWSSAEAAELLARAADWRDKAAAVHFIALGAPPREDESVVDVLERMSRDPDPHVRRAVVISIGYLASWPALRTLLETIEREDPDENIGRDAGTVREDLDEPDVLGRST